MIKGINTSSNFITVTGGNAAIPYINGTNLSSGQLRYNPNMQNFEVYDGTTWHMIASNYATVDLSEYAKSILMWASRKMQEEKELEVLCAKYPGLGKARDNYEMFKKFVDAQEQADQDSGEVTAG